MVSENRECLFSSNRTGKVSAKYAKGSREEKQEVKTNITQSIFCLDGHEFAPRSFVAVAEQRLSEKCECEPTCTA